LPFEKRVHVVAALVEGNSIRSTDRLTGVHRDTIMRFGVQAGDGCARVHDALVRGVRANVIQADELWTFVGKKRRNVTFSDDPVQVGDQYVYLAMDSVSKLIISYRIGKRNLANTTAFIRDLRHRVVGKPQLSTDGLQFYRNAVEAAFGPDIDFAQVDKDYEVPVTPEAAGRYSPGRIIREEKRVVVGEPDM